MKVKFLKVRVGENFVESDQRVLDQFLANHSVSKVESAFLQQEECWSVILFYEENLAPTTLEQTTVCEPPQFSATDQRLFESLKSWRTGKSKEKNIPPYCIATNSELLSILREKPVKKEQLCGIKGFGKYKVENYGEEILTLLGRC